MKFLSIYKHVERNTPPSQEEMVRMGKLVEEGMKAGWLLATEGCRRIAAFLADRVVAEHQHDVDAGARH